MGLFSAQPRGCANFFANEKDVRGGNPFQNQPPD
jgi:hypothetical protein